MCAKQYCASLIFLSVFVRAFASGGSTKFYVMLRFWMTSSSSIRLLVYCDQ